MYLRYLALLLCGRLILVSCLLAHIFSFRLDTPVLTVWRVVFLERLLAPAWVVHTRHDNPPGSICVYAIYLSRLILLHTQEKGSVYVCTFSTFLQHAKPSP